MTMTSPKKWEADPNKPRDEKPWGQNEFSLFDPYYDLLTFGQSKNTSTKIRLLP